MAFLLNSVSRLFTGNDLVDGKITNDAIRFSRPKLIILIDKHSRYGDGKVHRDDWDPLYRDLIK